MGQTNSLVSIETSLTNNPETREFVESSVARRTKCAQFKKMVLDQIAAAIQRGERRLEINHDIDLLEDEILSMKYCLFDHLPGITLDITMENDTKTVISYC